MRRPEFRIHSSTSSSLVAALFGAAAVVCGLMAGPASGGTVTTWTGGGGNGDWSTSSNWTTAVNTSGTFDFFFGGTTQVSTTNTLGIVNVGSMTFTNTGTLADGQNAFFSIDGSTLALNNSTISTVAASGGLFITNSDGDTIWAPITLAGTSSVVTNNNHNLSLRGNISGGGALIFDDGSVGTTEYAYVSGSNSYTGGTVIQGGFLQTSVRGTPGASNNFALGTGPVTVQDNGTLLLRNNSILTNPLTVSGSGSGLNPSNNSPLVGSFGVAGGTAEYRGNITLAGDSRFSVASSASGDTTSKLLVSGNVDIGPYLLTLRSRRSNVAGTGGMLVQVTGTISGSGGVAVVGEGPWSQVRIDGNNSYSGGTTVTTGTLIVGSGSALGSGFLAVNTSALDLNGQTLFVGALSGSSTGVINSTVAGPARLVTTATTNSTYAGTIGNGSGTVGLTKAGGGTLSLTGSNTYSGVTNVDGGVLALDAAGSIAGGGDITFGGGTLRYSGSNQSDFSAQFEQSTAAISIDTNGQVVTYSSAIANTNQGGLTKSGAGTLYLNGSNQYAGTTTVDAGTLGGTGSVMGLLSVSDFGVFDPGASGGATAIFGAGAFAQADGGTTIMQVNGTSAGSQYDQVLFSGTSKTVSWGGVLDLTLSGSYADFTEFNLFSGFTGQTGNLGSISFAAPGSPYSLLSFTGPVGGLWSTSFNGYGQKLTFDQTSGILRVVPEPASLALTACGLGIAGLRLIRRRRRRQAA